MAVRADDVDLERDRDLVQRYQAGDPDAFDDLYRRYFDRLHGFCQRRVGDRHVAEELAQEAFARALRAMPSFAGERRFYPWMTVIAQRLCIDHHRRRARIEPSADIDLGTVDADHEALFAAVDLAHLSTAMERLAPRHREVLELHDREGLTYHEIAARLDVPVSTVEALLHRARKALRREFMSVAGSGGRLMGLPILGLISARIVNLRARATDRIGELIAYAAPAAAVVATAGVVLAPGSGTTNVDTVGAATKTSAVEVAAAPAPTLPTLPELTLPEATALPTTPAAVPVTVDAPAQPSLSVAATDVYTGDAAVQKGEEIAEMPTFVDAGVVEVGADLQALVTHLTDRLLGRGADDEAAG